MKTSFLLMLVVLLVGCSAGNSANNSTNNFSQSKDASINEANSTVADSSFSVNNIDKADLKEISLQQVENEKFRVVPDEFKNVDFKNFKFPDVKIKDGNYEDFNPKNPGAGHMSFSLDDVYYIDTSSDSKKEAAVFLTMVGCGASCDGGSTIIYFYASENGKAKFLDKFESGSHSGGCFLKSFSIKEEKIYIQQFGRCLDNPSVDKQIIEYSCKFCVKDLTQTTYSFVNNKLKRESGSEMESPEINVMNYQTEISINN